MPFLVVILMCFVKKIFTWPGCEDIDNDFTFCTLALIINTTDAYVCECT